VISIFLLFSVPEYYLFIAIPTIGWIAFYSYWTFVKRRVRLRNNNIDPEDMEVS
jgi:hypothetical protein